MGKKKSNVPAEEHLLLPTHPYASSVAAATSASQAAPTPIVDTHTHLLSTFAFYKSKYPTGKYDNVFEFVRGVYFNQEGKSNVEAIVDVWCEAPVRKEWKELADSALTEEGRKEVWGGIEYWFVLGVHPHEAKSYDDSVEADILEAMAHPRCVGLGEIGLDYHYSLSPHPIQQEIFARQLRIAVKLNKPLTIHTREAEEDTERILKKKVPKDWKIHIHCFTDSPEFAQRLLDHFPNLHIGITGVITYASNLNTSEVIRRQLTSPTSSPSNTSALPNTHLRILLETDAPYMVPGNIYKSLPNMKGKFPLCHTGMVPWTAEFVSDVAKEVPAEGGREWDVESIMTTSRRNARFVYGV